MDLMISVLITLASQGKPHSHDTHRGMNVYDDDHYTKFEITKTIKYAENPVHSCHEDFEFIYFYCT